MPHPCSGPRSNGGRHRLGRRGGWRGHDDRRRHDAEEIHLYRFEPAHGFGVQVLFDDDAGERTARVLDGTATRITDGWHPLVAAPGITMYYLWAIAGDTDVVIPEMHPVFS